MGSEAPPAVFLCRIEELRPGCPRGFRVGQDLSLVALRTATGIRLYRNRCPHAGFELNWLPDRFLDHSGRYLHCQVHGALFAPESGRCLAGPCAGKRLEPVPHQERDGGLYLLPAPGAALLH